jgi:hypothetical protein
MDTLRSKDYVLDGNRTVAGNNNLKIRPSIVRDVLQTARHQNFQDIWSRSGSLNLIA